ncbi:MAG: YfhO family protein [Ruminococcus sp.]|nr:YfhO family protein [Ruminococcus sp.]
MGFSSLGHYTSLTDNDNMTLQKKLGYTSVWMEVGTAGGTRFTNALYSAKYKLVKSNSSEDSIYSSNGYSIVEMPYSYGLGIITDSDLSDCEEIPDELTRAQIQQYIFSSLYNDKTLITEYDYNAETSSGISYNSNNGKYAISNGACIYYTIDVSDRQVLYADCFDDISNNLSEDYYDSLEVSVNGITISNSYPSSTKNCLLELGEFEDETVTVTIKCKSQIKCYSFGVFSLDSEVLEEAIEATDCANLTYDGSKLIGNTTVSGEKTCVLSVPYNDGFTVRVNGEKVEYSRVFSDFISFELDNGENEIEISFIPKGFVPGLVITIVGAAVFVLYILFKDRIEFKDIVGKISIIAVGAVVVIGFILVYVFPMVVKMFTAFKE